MCFFCSLLFFVKVYWKVWFYRMHNVLLVHLPIANYINARFILYAYNYYCYILLVILCAQLQQFSRRTALMMMSGTLQRSVRWMRIQESTAAPVTGERRRRQLLSRLLN